MPGGNSLQRIDERIDVGGCVVQAEAGPDSTRNIAFIVSFDLARDASYLVVGDSQQVQHAWVSAEAARPHSDAPFVAKNRCHQHVPDIRQTEAEDAHALIGALRAEQL